MYDFWYPRSSLGNQVGGLPGALHVIVLKVLDIDVLVNHDFFIRSIRKLLRTCVRSSKGQLMKIIYRVWLFQKIVKFCVKIWNFIESLRNDRKVLWMVSVHQNMHSEIEIRWKNVVIWAVRVIPPVTRLTVYRAVVVRDRMQLVGLRRGWATIHAFDQKIPICAEPRFSELADTAPVHKRAVNRQPGFRRNNSYRSDY